MKSLFKKSMLVGLGSFSVIKRKAEQVAKELVRKEVFSKKEATALVKRMEQEGKKVEKQLRDVYEKRAKKHVDTARKRAKDEVTRLRKKVERLEKRLAGRRK